jgi:hypothetical protein
MNAIMYTTPYCLAKTLGNLRKVKDFYRLVSKGTTYSFDIKGPGMHYGSYRYRLRQSLPLSRLRKNPLTWY